MSLSFLLVTACDEKSESDKIGISSSEIYKTADRKTAMPSLLGPCLKEHFWRYFVFIYFFKLFPRFLRDAD